MKIKYIGPKPIKPDNVAGTGTIWVGTGDVHDVPDKLWPLFAEHPNVWQRADGVILPGLPKPGMAPAHVEPTVHRFVAHDIDGKDVVLDAFEDSQLKAFAQVNELNVDLRKKGDVLREAIVKATAESITEATEA